MAEIRDILVLDSSRAEAAIGRVVAAAHKMRQSGGDALKDFERGLGSAGDVASELSREIEALNRKATLDRAKASSDDYRQALERAAAAAKSLRRVTDDVGGSANKLRGEMGGGASATHRLGESMVTTTNQAMQLIGTTVELGRKIHEFSMLGVDANRVAAQYGGQLENLRAATGNAIDDTTLMRMDLMARKTGLWGEEIDAVARLALQVARDEGEEFVTIFERMQDASPEQMEKWGLVTSDLVAQLQGLDSVQQKQALRQELVNAGLQITNEEIAEQTHALERAQADWDNWVSSIQQAAAEMLDSDGASDAIQRVQGDLENATVAVVGLVTKWDEMLGKMGQAVGIEDVGIASFFEVGWEMTVIGQISTAIDLYDKFQRRVADGVLEVEGLSDAKREDREAGLEDLANLAAQYAKEVPATRNEKSKNRTEYMEENDFFDFTNDSSVLDWQRSQYRSGGRRKKAADQTQHIGSTLTGLAGFGGDIQVGLRSQQLDAAGIGSIDDAQATLLQRLFPEDDSAGLAANVDSGLDGLIERYSTAFDSIAFEAETAFDRIAAAAAANENFALASADAMTGAFLSSFENIIAGGDSFRADMMGIMGELWGQLSAGFLAWATAEGNLLAGNPWAAFGAAAALGMVGAAISGLGRRGSGGGSSSGGTSAQRFNERERERKEEKPETRMTLELVGIPVPDETARQLADAVERNMMLKGAT